MMRDESLIAEESDSGKVMAGFVMGVFVAPSFWDLGLYGRLLEADAAEWFSALGTFVAAAVALWIANSSNSRQAREREDQIAAQRELATAKAVGIHIEVSLARKAVNLMIRLMENTRNSPMSAVLEISGNLARVEADVRLISFTTTERFAEKLEYLPHDVRVRLVELITYKPQVVEQIVLAVEHKALERVIKILGLFDETLVKADRVLAGFIGVAGK